MTNKDSGGVFLLRDLVLDCVYDTSEGKDIVHDLLVPLLSNSNRYRRGVGFFTSGWLRLNTKGLVEFAKREGIAQIVTSPYLSKADVVAIVEGEKARKEEVVYQALEREVVSLERELEHNTLVALAWLVADGLLEFKIAIPKNQYGDYHDKNAIFSDGKDVVVLHGSMNDSVKGIHNGEGISVFRSWVEGQKEFVDKHVHRFEKLFYKANPFYDIYEMPESVERNLVQYTSYGERPYEKHETDRKHEKRGSLSMGKHTLRPYQREAIDNWVENGMQGIYAMATGIGKTFTSLAASYEMYDREGRIALIISVPFTHLVQQWEQDVLEFGFQPILCMGNSKEWYFAARTKIDDFNFGALPHICLIVTHSSNADEGKFLKLVKRIKAKDSILFLADEVHYLGANYLQRSLITDVKKRIGLSATPERWRDPDGTKVLRDYFKEEVISFGIEKAIEQGFLTPYLFYPRVVQLTEEEYARYNKLSVRIAQAMSNKEESEKVEALLYQRTNIIHRAEHKLEAFAEQLKRDIEEVGKKEFGHAIVYCPEGDHRRVLKRIASMGLRVQEFIGETPPKKRKEILQAFADKRVQVLVAMKCLDEGVNVPATKHAYFLASSTNPRQFIQRRGRILRTSKSTGKTHAILHDYFVFPPYFNHDHVRKLVKKEMARFMEFQFCCQNAKEAFEYMYPFLKKVGLEHLLHLSREEIYELLMEGEGV